MSDFETIPTGEKYIKGRRIRASATNKLIENQNYMIDHAFEKPTSFIIRKRGVNYEAIHGSGSNQAGKILATGTSTDALVTFQAVEAIAPENSKVNVKHGDYTFSAKWNPTKKLRLHGEGIGTRLLPSGSFDAVDMTNLALFDIVWRDASGVDFDASFDPNMFEEALHQTGRREIKIVKFDTGTVNLWGFGDKILACTGVAGATVYGIGKIYIIYPTGKIVDITYNANDFKGAGSYEPIEFVAGYIDPQGNIFVTTHPYVNLLKLPYNSKTWQNKLSVTDGISGYGIEGIFVGYLIANSGGTLSAHQKKIYRSTDMGETWNVVWSEAVNQHLFGIRAHEKTILVGGYNEIIRSADYGASFTKITITCAVRNFAYLGDGVWIGSSNVESTYLVSLDDGASWFSVANTLPIKYPAYSSSNIHSNGKVIAIASRDTEIALSRNGSSWTFLNLPLKGMSLRGVYVTDDTLYASGMTLGDYGDAANRANQGNVFIIPLDVASIKGQATPHFLWNNVAVLADGTSLPLLTKGTSKQTFFFKSNAIGTLTFQIYDEQAKVYADLETLSIDTANKLFSKTFTLPVTTMQLKFSVAATVTCWAVLED